MPNSRRSPRSRCWPAAECIIDAMDIVGVDPRDQTWEVDTPRYRVYFHGGSGTSYEYAR